MRSASDTSCSAVSSGTLPISRMYMRTKSVPPPPRSSSNVDGADRGRTTGRDEPEPRPVEDDFFVDGGATMSSTTSPSTEPSRDPSTDASPASAASTTSTASATAAAASSADGSSSMYSIPSRCTRSTIVRDQLGRQLEVLDEHDEVVTGDRTVGPSGGEEPVEVIHGHARRHVRPVRSSSPHFLTELHKPGYQLL